MFSSKHTQETALASLRQALDSGLGGNELAKLASSPEALVRATVAAHPGTSLLSLLRLAEDESASVRAAVARNPRQAMPEDLHERLAEDKHAEVRLALAGNPSVPRSILVKLARGRDKDVQLVARTRLAEEGGARGLLAKLSIPRG